jgi:hypothetical protein
MRDLIGRVVDDPLCVLDTTYTPNNGGTAHWFATFQSPMRAERQTPRHGAPDAGAIAQQTGP